MKKMGLSIMTVIFLLATCGCNAKIADNNVDYSGQVLRGQISSMEKTTVDLVLGKLKENVNGDFLPQDGDFEMPMDPEDRPELPEGEFPFSEGEMPEMPEGMEPFNGEMPEGMEPFNGERPELPEGAEPFGDDERPEPPEGLEPFNGEGERPEKPEGFFDSFPGQMSPGNMTPSYTFTPNNKTAHIDLRGASVILADGSEGSFDDLKEGDVVEITVGKNNQVETVTVYEVTVRS